MACYFLLAVFGIFCLFAYLLMASFARLISQMMEPFKPELRASMDSTIAGSRSLVSLLVEITGTNQMWKLAMVFILGFSLVGLFWSLRF